MIFSTTKLQRMKKKSNNYVCVSKIKNFKGSGCRGRNCILVRAFSCDNHSEDAELRYIGYYQVSEWYGSEAFRSYVINCIMKRMMIDSICVIDTYICKDDIYYLV